MSVEDLKDAIVSGDSEKVKEPMRSVVRDQIQKSYNTQSDKDLNESVAAIAGLAALGGGWGWVRSKVRKADNHQVLNEFIKAHDTQNIISKQLPEKLRRFKMVSTLTDLENMERSIEQMLNQLESIESRVDQFVDSTYRSEKTIGDKILIRDPQKEKRNIKRFISEFIENTRRTFEQQVEQKKDELLS